MRIEKVIDNINIDDYIESIEIINGTKIKVIYDIPDDILKGNVFYNEKQLEAPKPNTTEVEYEKPFIPYPRKKTKVQNITGAKYDKPITYDSRTDAAKAIGVNRETLYSRIRKGKGKATITTLKGTFKITAIEE